MITTDITAGGISIDSNPRLRRLRKDYELIQEIDARTTYPGQSQIGAHRPATRTLHHYL
jgi:hypothetical protein